MLDVDFRWTLILLGCTLLGCGDEPAPEQAGSETGADTDTDTGDTGQEEDERVLVNHDFGEFVLEPFQEVSNCVQWTVDNDEAVYVQGVTLSNLGYFHHSNWFVVPEDMYEGPDGFFKCGDRDFEEIGAAVAGTVLFAQSTQSFAEYQRTADGAVIKIPPRHKVVAGTHMLNVGPAQTSTQLFMSLEIIHPAEVELVLSPFRLSYLDIDIPADARSRFTGVCANFGERYAEATGAPIDMKLHYALAHYHYLGDYFDLTFTGGPNGEQSVYRINGFNGEANGIVFDPPLDLSGVEAMRYTCGYDNWRDVNVGWGIGDQEMCVMLALAEAKIIFDASVTGGTVAVGTTEDGALQFEGPCGVLALAKNPNQSMPTAEELDAELYIPPSGDAEVPPIPECIDHDPTVAPVIEPTLTNVAGVVFQQSCAFNACHGDSGQAAGLNLQAPDLRAELLNHEVMGNAGASLIEPGDLDNSWLYQIISRCEPDGGTGSHMPLNAPVLVNDRSIALVREWILDGAPDN